MSHALAPLVQFTGGEWAPALDNRIDLEGYRNALRQGRNVIVTKQGGATRRPGTQYIAQGKSPAAGGLGMSRMQKFQYAPGTAFMLEFCDKGIRFYASGVQVQATPSAWVSGTNYPDGAFVTNASVTYYLFNGPLINSTTAPGSDGTHWVAQTAYEVPAPYSATNFTAPIYWTADVFVLRCLQINDVVYITHPNFPVWKLTRYGNTNWVMQQVQFLTPAMLDENVTDISLAASAVSGTGVTISATAPNWVTGAQYVPGNSVTDGGNIYNCLISHVSGTFLTDLANGDWQSVFVFQAAHIGSYWQLAYNRTASYIQALATGTTAAYTLPSVSAGQSGYTLPLVGTWEIQTYGTWQGVVTIIVSYDNGVSYQNIVSLTSMGDANFSISGQELNGGIYGYTITGTGALASTTPPRIVLTADNQFVYGLVEITGASNVFPYAAVGTVIGAPLYSTGPTTYWSEGAWSAVRGYPNAITVYQERVWYGATTFQPQRVWATQTDDIENFALIDGSQSTYGLAFDLNAPGRGPIRWLAAQTDLFVGMASAEWIISSGSGTSTAITPTAINALEHTVNGSAPNLPGLIIGQACMYVQRRGRAFQQMLFSVFTNKYMSNEMQVSSQHLMNPGIEQFDYQQQFEGQSLIWVVCGDGSLISMTYAMEQKIFSWTKHITTDGIYDFGFISAQVIYGPDGSDDELWVSVLRNAGLGATSCSIERMNPVDWQTSNLGQPQLNQAAYADCYTSYTSPSTNQFTLPTVINALGRTFAVSIVPAGGTGMLSIRNLSPVIGVITIPNYVPKTGDVVVIGLTINWAIQPMRLDIDPAVGPNPGIYKSIRKLVLRVLNSIGGQWSCKGVPPVQGTLSTVTDIKAYPITENSGNPAPFTPNIPLDVQIDVGGLFGYSLDPAFAIQGYDPLPFTLLGISVQSDTGGKA